MRQIDIELFFLLIRNPEMIPFELKGTIKPKEDVISSTEIAEELQIIS
tara:strand:+ start:1471 stop:1614 length:144 start_codon:yes stop_codon:yes gene_type:complete